MTSEVFNLLLTTAVALTYLIGSMKAVQPVFKSISYPYSHATGVLFFGVILGFGLNLSTFSEVASSAFYFYAAADEMGKGALYMISFAAVAFVFSYLMFRLSFAVVGIATAENEKAELAKNNYTLAGLHLVIYNITCFIVNESLVEYASTFISYSQFPN